MTLPVFADVDTGVDDAVALVYLLANPAARLVGVASTGGNVAVQQVCRNNLALLELCGAAGVPVSKGADAPLDGPVHTSEALHGPQGLGYAELPPGSGRLTEYDAAAAWVAAAREHLGQLIGLATGPLTNLALALRAEPALPTLLRRLVMMGGAFSGERSGWAEFNVGFDPEAAAEVFIPGVSARPAGRGGRAGTRTGDNPPGRNTGRARARGGARADDPRLGCRAAQRGDRRRGRPGGVFRPVRAARRRIRAPAGLTPTYSPSPPLLPFPAANVH